MKPIADLLIGQIETERAAYPEYWDHLLPKFERDVERMAQYLTDEERRRINDALQRPLESQAH